MCQLDICRRVHEKIHDKKNYKCEHCSYATTDNFRLKIHLKKEHGMEDEEIQGCNSIAILNFGSKTEPHSGPYSVLGHYKIRHISKL